MIGCLDEIDPRNDGADVFDSLVRAHRPSTCSDFPKPMAVGSVSAPGRYKRKRGEPAPEFVPESRVERAEKRPVEDVLAAYLETPPGSNAARRLARQLRFLSLN